MNNHYSENEIQQYIDGTQTPTQKKQIEEHLLNCDNCRKEYEHFLELFNLLEKDNDFNLSPDFAEKVTSSIENSDEKNFFKKYREIFWSTLALLTGLGASLYFTGFDFLKFRIPELTIPKIHVDFARFENIYSILSGMNMNFFICIILIIALITFFDQMLLKNKFDV